MVVGLVTIVHDVVVGRVTPAAAQAGDTSWDVSLQGAGCISAFALFRQVCSARPCVLASVRNCDENDDVILPLLNESRPLFLWNGVR